MLKNLILVVFIFCSTNASLSLAQEENDIGKKFSRQYNFLKDFHDPSDIPFPEIFDAEAKRILTTSTYFIAPFGTQLPAHPNLNFYQLFGVDCVSCPSLVSYYLVAQGGYGNAITRVYGPINFDEISLSKEIAQLKKINIFAIGMVGFVGHISEGEILYRKILDTKYAEATFIEILQSPSSTNEARIYAACGLRKLSPSRFPTLLKGMNRNEETASVLRVDILKKEKISDLLSSIENAGCGND